MNNNQISNPKKEVTKGFALNEKDYANSLLSCLKEMTKNYTVAMTEASNETLYQEYHRVFNELINLQRKVYEFMFRSGWYILEKAETQKINEKYQMLSQEIQDLKNN